jgi:hypothetical protein
MSQEAAQQLLSRSDAVRNPAFSYSTRVVLSEYKAGREHDTMVLRLYARPAQRKGEYQTLVSFLQPSRELGKHMLKSGNDLWFYDPAGNASIRLSPQQRLLGQAANADVVSTAIGSVAAPPNCRCVPAPLRRVTPAWKYGWTAPAPRRSAQGSTPTPGLCSRPSSTGNSAPSWARAAPPNT